MPRPGPRPYECVRRAWHSERHQPIRGSLIQEIFRIANEIHSPSTKKKKEWQEKLPIVVLKAEEIIYSKANSEAEYMDPKTLWDRANDAINTIIRREECSEDTGEFLQPCIEGCFPRRASRSQRNNHPRGYLTRNPDLSNVIEGNPKPSSSFVPHYSNFRGKEPQNLVLPVKSCLNSEPFLSSQNCLPGQGSFSSQSYAVYPLYYGSCSRPIEPQLKLGDHSTLRSVSNDRPEIDMSRNFSLCSEDSTMNWSRQPNISINPPNNECDLSLRLGFPSMQGEKDAQINGFQEKVSVVGSKHESIERFSFYHKNNAGSRDESLDVNLMVRKRKAVDQMKDPRYPWEPKFLPTYSNEGTSTTG
ncbi:uncharacterized protein LOC110733594 isoform X2 [Chenopodium quinoa]|uniref:uncharacterized protein LOC110733594 isoform X2 n=1 Tax=Chenopodium quinoa TaxID=63459 RepID=UPI000B77F978|nr:uncharacterized protein LOC110733594 isoform X2 [Chenopodium quinoa]